MHSSVSRALACLYFHFLAIIQFQEWNRETIKKSANTSGGLKANSGITPLINRRSQNLQFYSNLTKWCDLYTTEKQFIITKPELATLNKQNELISTYRHRQKFILAKLAATCSLRTDLHGWKRILIIICQTRHRANNTVRSLRSSSCLTQWMNFVLAFTQEL